MTSMVNPRRCALGGAIMIAGCLLLTACAGGGASSGSSASAAGQAVPAPRSAGATGTAGSADANGTAGSASAKATGLTAGLTPANQSIIYTATITIRASDVGATARRITDIAEAAGGYISAENAGSASPGRTGKTIGITLKIPVPSYPAVLARLSAPSLGKQLGMKQQATDVTQAVANVDSLVTSEQDAIAALEGLLSHAASVADLLQVQQQISADETTLNSLLAQQRALNGETSYATVTMTLVSPPHAAQRKPAQHSFLTGLLAGWRALRHSASLVATAVGAALPFLAIIAALAAAAYAGRRRYLRRRAAGPPAAA